MSVILVRCYELSLCMLTLNDYLYLATLIDSCAWFELYFHDMQMKMLDRMF
jgi:hypothetical protein